LIQQGRKVVLFEDGDSGHGTGKKNPVHAWKEKHRLKYYFNVAKFPDLNIIENCWLLLKNMFGSFLVGMMKKPRY
jgi:hypothetical protein